MRHRLRILPALLLTAVLVAVGLAAPAHATPTAATAATAGATAQDQREVPESPVSCEVDYLLTNDWGSGFTAEIIVTNTGSVPVLWEVIVVWGPGTQITQVWNAIVTQSGNTMLFEPPPPWGGPLQVLWPGQSASFGLVGVGPRFPESIEVNCWAV